MKPLRILLRVCFLLGNFFFLETNSANCNGRQILREEEGYISDGVGKYSDNMQCEWLIDAGSPNKTIHLSFLKMGTECSFDFLFVYDGNTYNSRLIASLSGDSPPDPLVAHSGYMLLHLFSDRNYVMVGFDARYKVMDCPWDCSERGVCKNGTCQCQPDYNGLGCQVEDCPDDCGDHGRCRHHSYRHQYCHCDAGYMGNDCSLQVASNQGQGEWYTVRDHDEDGGISGRTSHTSVFINDCMWVFGGFDLNLVLDDLWRYCQSDNKWQVFDRECGNFRSADFTTSEAALGEFPSTCDKLNDDDVDNIDNNNKSLSSSSSVLWPGARSGHASDLHKDGFFIFGGILSTGSHSNELWHFNTTSLEWSLVAVNSTVKPHRVTGHTLTTVRDYLYLVGGKSEERVFTDCLFRIDARNPQQWERVLVKGGNYPPKRYVGHSTVYHQQSNSLLVFGGYIQGSGLFSDRTHEIQAFNIDDQYWALLKNENWREKSMPRDRAYHSAVIVGNYMLVYAGNTHKHSEVEICYTWDLFFYHLGCHVWVNHTYFTGTQMPAKGRFGHTAVVANGNIMFVFGGYSGSVLGDLLAYKLPSTVAEFQCSPSSTACSDNLSDSNNSSSSSSSPSSSSPQLSSEPQQQQHHHRRHRHRDHCEVYRYSKACQDDPECVYCNQGRNDGFNASSCVHRDRIELCKSEDYHDSMERCPGICSTLHTCGACVSQGKGAEEPSLLSSQRWNVHIKACSWCVKEAQCQTRSDPFGTCLNAKHTNSGLRGWWGGLSANLTSLSQCQKDDFPSGLHWIKYKSPMNASFPDELEIMRKTKGKISNTNHKQVEGSFNLTTTFRGYIHPLNAPSPPGENLTLELGMKNARAKLYLSTDDTEANKELVISNMLALNVHETEQAVRPSGLPIFPNTSLGHKYFVEQVTETDSKSQKTSITLSWNGGHAPLSKHSALTSEFLEPYSNGNCSASYNCYGCLSDALCGWCEVARKCVLRNISSADSACQDDTGSLYLITSPSECPSCSRYVECSSCANDPLCEWEVREAHCTRRLRKTNAITNTSQCQLPCHQRSTRSGCIKEKRECVWCENTHTCLPFLEYVTRYIYGQCTSWVDDPDLASGRHSCSNYKLCGTCLIEFGCGWCSSDHNPNDGLCLHGDFAGMDSNQSCSSHLAAAYNISEHEASSWSYDQCPDVDECMLGLHNCHANATCINTYTSFMCECNRGFIANGATQCDKTCYYDCVNGFCSGAPDFKCDCNIGWTNHSCEVNCGCNNRSTCSQGVGLCDACQDLTAGPRCEHCVAGAYIDPKDPEKCVPCHCNGHADKSKGECNNMTGKCHCTNNTEGHHCERCQSGFYGNSRNGGRCYLGCDQRTFLTNVTSGALGFHEGSSADDKYQVYCLWVLSAYSTYSTTTSPGINAGSGSSAPGPMTTTAMTIPPDGGAPYNVASIDVTLEADLKVECGKDAVYVYDNIPWFIAGDGMGNAKLLGSFCGTNPGGDLTVRAHDGVATILFRADLLRSMTSGFNATFRVHSCPEGCHGNQVCHEGQCVCKADFWGPGCGTPICPEYCHEHKNQGYCHDNICICRPGFTGESCGKKPGANYLDLQILTDSRLPLPSWMRQEQQQDSRPYFMPTHFQKFHPSGLGGHQGGGGGGGGKRLLPGEEVGPGGGGHDGMDWFDVEDDVYGPSPRAGHTLTQCGDGLLFVYGGLSVQHIILDDMWMYNVTSGVWTRIIPPTSINPPGRYYHAAACIPLLKMIYVFGGFEADHMGEVPLASLGVKANNSLWKFNIESHAWTTENSPPWLPGLAGHTLTHIGLTKLILVGGFSTQNYFNEKVFEYNVSNGIIAWAQWAGMTGAVPIGLYGHSAVFEQVTHTIYVFGGYLFRSDHWFVSNELFTLDVKDKSWNMLFPDANSQWEGRVFHAALSLGDRMVVVGGLTAWGSYANDIIVFRYRCSTWHQVRFKEAGRPQDTISMLGLDAASLHNHIYLFGGFSGTSSGRLARVTLPGDLCALISDPTMCSGLAGCQLCAKTTETGESVTMCYNAEGSDDTQPVGCMGQPPKLKRCDERRYKERMCSHYRTCSHCLATHPHFKDAGPNCNWCINCQENHCIRRDQECPFLETCSLPQHTITSVSDCFEYFCPASDCQKCGKRENCLWTRHFERSSETSRGFNALPMFNWNCVTMNMKPAATGKFESMPPEPCPTRCYQHGSCENCLRSPGSEGGSKQCYWSESLKECMAPAYVSLRCSQGECGYLHIGSHYKCPDPCDDKTKCADCIATPGCGWCAFGGGNGQGICMPGGVFKPSKGFCVEGNHSVAVKAVSNKMSSVYDVNAIWSYHQCQPENECINGHHTCDPDTQDCHDWLENFVCNCKHGYIKDKNGNCEPVCHQGCVHGTCYKPDACRCDFGWVGNNCSVECKCNKHSNCPSISSTSKCIKCANNTMGSRCQHCQRNFVGNPENGGRCMPCWEFCNNHTDTCMSQHEYDMSKLKSYYHQVIQKGPRENNAVCIDCLHNTTGQRCEKCTTGHFRRHSRTLMPCQECQCNGHSSVCDTDTGENCKCKNNTETNCGDAKEESQCWKHQCAQCKEYFLGTPTDGHQCYRQMNVDRDYCFDPNTQKNCDQVPQPLLPGRTVFFAVQPKYLNVNIRITIDVTMGSADIFLSNEKDTYQVFLDRDEFFHDIHLDKQYAPSHASLARRSVEESIGAGGVISGGGGGGGDGIRGGNPAGMSVEDIVVNDEAFGQGQTVFESESVRITQEVPDFLKMKSSDDEFYKMSQFKSAEKPEEDDEEEEGGGGGGGRGGEKNEDMNEVGHNMKGVKGEKEKVKGSGGSSVSGAKVVKPVKHKKLYSSGDNQSREKFSSHLSSENEVGEKPTAREMAKLNKRRRKKKKEQLRMEKPKKKKLVKSSLQDMWEFLRKSEQEEKIDRSYRTGDKNAEVPYSDNVTQLYYGLRHPARRRYRRGLFLYNRLLRRQVRKDGRRKSGHARLLLEREEEDDVEQEEEEEGAVFEKWGKHDYYFHGEQQHHQQQPQQQPQRKRRGVLGLSVTDSIEVNTGGGNVNNKNSGSGINGGGGVGQSGIKIGEIKAGALNTYITVSQHNSVLVVRDVRFRLVIMLPRDQHDLKSSRFYIIARARGGNGGNAHNTTFGNLYFRQDQPHIDLFVFFSVFFSCFFLFLSVCVLLWKLKQTFDARRSRQMREREMECMASRPFARILVLLEPEGGLIAVINNTAITTTPTPTPPTPQQQQQQPPHIISSSAQLIPRRYRLTRGSGGGGGGGGDRQNRNNNALYNNMTSYNDVNTTVHSILPPHSGGGGRGGDRGGGDRDLGVVPIGIEPTDDGLAAISTVLFQLPGGATAPARLCLGSSLTTRVVASSSHSQKAGNLRRRTSASSC